MGALPGGPAGAEPRGRGLGGCSCPAGLRSVPACPAGGSGHGGTGGGWRWRAGARRAGSGQEGDGSVPSRGAELGGLPSRIGALHRCLAADRFIFSI